MNLSSSEEAAYKAIYAKIATNTQFSKSTCVKLMVKRGGVPQEIANKVLSKKFLFILSKILKDLVPSLQQPKRGEANPKPIFLPVEECSSSAIGIKIRRNRGRHRKVERY